MNSFEKLLQAVSRATEQKRLQWEPLLEDSFRAELADGSIVIAQSIAGGGEGGSETLTFCYLVRVTNRRGVVAEEQEFAPGNTHHGLVQQLFTNARHLGSGSEELFGKMIEALEPAGR